MGNAMGDPEQPNPIGPEQPCFDACEQAHPAVGSIAECSVDLNLVSVSGEILLSMSAKPDTSIKVIMNAVDGMEPNSHVESIFHGEQPLEDTQTVRGAGILTGSTLKVIFCATWYCVSLAPDVDSGDDDGLFFDVTFARLPSTVQTFFQKLWGVEDPFAFAVETLAIPAGHLEYNSLFQLAQIFRVDQGVGYWENGKWQIEDASCAPEGKDFSDCLVGPLSLEQLESVFRRISCEGDIHRKEHCIFFTNTKWVDGVELSCALIFFSEVAIETGEVPELFSRMVEPTQQMEGGLQQRFERIQIPGGDLDSYL